MQNNPLAQLPFAFPKQDTHYKSGKPKRCIGQNKQKEKDIRLDKFFPPSK